MKSNEISVEKRCKLLGTISQRKWSARILQQTGRLIRLSANGETLAEEEASREKTASLILETIMPLKDESEAAAALKELEASILSTPAAS